MKDTSCKELNCKPLTEKQQMLLSSYLDNQCSFLNRLRVERLMRTNSEARSFIAMFRASSQLCKSLSSQQTNDTDLWQRICIRIENEERAARYLGERESLSPTPSSGAMRAMLTRPALIGSFSGAAITAVALLILTRPNPTPEVAPVYLGNQLMPNTARSVQQTSLSSGSSRGSFYLPNGQRIAIKPVLLARSRVGLRVLWRDANGAQISNSRISLMRQRGASFSVK